MTEAKTVSCELESLIINQRSDVADMRDSLLSFNRSDPNAARKALQNITVLRVYHQISRIIRYTSLMDELEDKLYQSMQSQIDQSDPDDPESWRILLNMQSRLQENMIASHKLLEPYLNFESLSFAEINTEESIVESDAMILDRDSREKLRSSAQEVLKALQQTSQNNIHEIEEIKDEAIYHNVDQPSKSRFKTNGLCPPSL